MKKIVVFGATGNLGAYTVSHLKETGFEVVAVGRRSSDNGFFQSIGVKYYSIDISKKEDFDLLPSNIDAVVHLAGELPSRNNYDPQLLFESIIIGTLNVLDYLVKAGGNKIVFPQSPFDIYEYHNKVEMIQDDLPRSFPKKGDHSIYVIAKNAAVDLIEHYMATYEISSFIFRFFTIYQYHPNPYHFTDFKARKMPYRMLMDRAINSLDIEIWGDYLLSKEMVYVKDFTQAVEKALLSELKGGIYNLGGKAVSLKEQIEGIVEVFSPKKNKSKLIYKPEKPNPRMSKFDTKKIEKDLGFKQRYSYLDSLIDFKKDMEEEPFALLWGSKEDFIKNNNYK